MKTLNQTIRFIGLMLVLASAAGWADTLTLTAETDRPVVLAGQKQTVYLRIGLTGCGTDILKERAPVNVALVIDKSGSMQGEKIEKAKEAAILALHRLKSSDIVSIVLYDSDVEVLVPATKMTNRQDLIRKIRQVRANGSTALYAGVQTGAGELRKFLSKNRVNRIVLLSDGLANVGPESPSALGQLGANLADEGISVTTVGLGLGYNEDLMSQLAYRSDGGHYFAEDADALAGVFDHEFGRALSVVAQKIVIEITCPEGVRPIRLLGREGIISGQRVSLDMNHIYSEHEKYVLLEVQTPPYTMQSGPVQFADVSVHYVDLKENREQTATTGFAASLSDSQKEVDDKINKRVYADVVEQIAIENNQRALALRDAGKVEEARQTLAENSTYLEYNAKELHSDKLASYAIENKEDSDNLEGENWTRQRKSMRENQSSRQTQR